jgi:hypothetical protein
VPDPFVREEAPSGEVAATMGPAAMIAKKRAAKITGSELDFIEPP